MTIRHVIHFAMLREVVVEGPVTFSFVVVGTRLLVSLTSLESVEDLDLCILRSAENFVQAI